MSASQPDTGSQEHEPDSSQQLAADEAALRQQLDELYKMGFRPCNFRDERLAPTVDEELLLRLIRRELPEKSAALVYRLVYSFRSWHGPSAAWCVKRPTAESQERRAKGCFLA